MKYFVFLLSERIQSGVFFCFSLISTLFNSVMSSLILPGFGKLMNITPGGMLRRESVLQVPQQQCLFGISMDE